MFLVTLNDGDVDVVVVVIIIVVAESAIYMSAMPCYVYML